MAKRPGDAFGFQFVTKAASGALSNADSLPTGVVVRNGTDDGTPVVTIANLSPGIYRASGTIPISYVSGDGVQVRVNATVAAVASAALHDFGTLDSKRVGDLYDDLASDVIAFAVNDLGPSPISFIITVPAGTDPDDLPGLTLKFSGLKGSRAVITDAVAITGTTARVTFTSPGFAVAPSNGATGIII